MLKEKILNNSEAVTNVTKYLAIMQKLGTGIFLYRGQANKEWPLRSGATRRICDEDKNAIINYSKVEIYIKELLETVKEKELDKHNQKYDLNCDLKILAQLQHYGAATPLLDFSKNSLIALWMACSDQPQEDGKVFIFNTEQQNIKRIKVKDLKSEVKFSSLIKVDSLEENEKTHKSYIWEPSHFNARIPVQSSVFFFAREEYSIEVSSIIISFKNKTKILAELENMFGLKEYNIYPDFAGFAQSNGAKKAYQVKDENYYIESAITLKQQGCFKEALNACNYALKLKGGIAKSFAVRGSIQDDLGNTAEALDDYNKAIKLDPNNSIVYHNRGYLLRTLYRNEEAIEDYSKAIALDPKDSAAYNNRGISKNNLGWHKKALDDYDKAIALDPLFILAYNNRGDCYYHLGCYVEAIKDCDKAIKLNPEYAFAYNNRGNAKVSLVKSRDLVKNYDEAIKDYDKAIELNPQYAMPYNGRGACKNDSGYFAEAIKDYDKAIKLDSKLVVAYLNRGVANKNSNKLDIAYKDLLKAKELAEEQNDTSLLESVERLLKELNKVKNKGNQNG